MKKLANFKISPFNFLATLFILSLALTLTACDGNDKDDENDVDVEGVLSVPGSFTVTLKDFITIWDTSKIERGTNSGVIYTAENDTKTLTLPLQTHPLIVKNGTNGAFINEGNFTRNKYEFNLTVNWGDGKTSTVTGPAEATHVYGAAGTYTVKISGIIKVNIANDNPYKATAGAMVVGGGWSFFNLDPKKANDSIRLIEIKNWGGFPIGLAGTSHQFATALFLAKISAADLPNFEYATSFYGTFINAETLTSIPNLDQWDTDKAKNVNSTFADAVKFNQAVTFTIPKAKDISEIFRGNYKLNKPIKLTTSGKLTDVSSMFAGASDFNQSVTITDTSQVTNMSRMFVDTAFNQPLNFNVTNVTNMSSMFSGAVNFNQNLSNWSVGKVTNCSNFAADSALAPNNKPKFKNCTE